MPSKASIAAHRLARSAIALYKQSAHAEAVPRLRRAIRLCGSEPDWRFFLAQSLFLMGEVDAAMGELARNARHRDPEVRRMALSKMAIFVPAAPGASNAEVLRVRRRLDQAESEFEAPAPMNASLEPRKRRKLRVGYVSAYLASRNWMKPVWPMLAAHDRRNFEIHIFVDNGLPDPRFGYVPHPADKVHFIGRRSNSSAARLIAAAELDVLVDLNGFSWPARLGLWRHRPAAVQVTWFNALATMGMASFDYTVADRVVLPRSEERFCTEHVLRVEGSYLTFGVTYRVPPVVEAPCRSGRPFTFGCLAPQYKITPGCTAALARILVRAPRARLILRNTFLDNASNRAAIRRRFTRLGVKEHQLELEGFASHHSFLRTYDRIDVALDTFPYSGGSTTMEALWQGVPVLTAAGDRWLARTSASLLVAAGLGEWVAPSRSALVRRAVELASSAASADRLGKLRAGMRARLAASAACHSVGLCRQLEGHYLTVVRRKFRRRSKP